MSRDASREAIRPINVNRCRTPRLSLHFPRHAHRCSPVVTANLIGRLRATRRKRVLNFHWPTCFRCRCCHTPPNRPLYDSSSCASFGGFGTTFLPEENHAGVLYFIYCYEKSRKDAHQCTQRR